MPKTRSQLSEAARKAWKSRRRGVSETLQARRKRIIEARIARRRQPLAQRVARVSQKIKSREQEKFAKAFRDFPRKKQVARRNRAIVAAHNQAVTRRDRLARAASKVGSKARRKRTTMEAVARKFGPSGARAQTGLSNAQHKATNKAYRRKFRREDRKVRRQTKSAFLAGSRKRRPM